VLSETRGPFEPLVSSADPPGTPPRISASTGEAGAGGRGDAGPAPDTGHPAEAHPAGEGQEQGDIAQARRLERIRDLYLTAEAIGEANVDKHFDQLLAQQRELISEYFKRPGASTPRGPAGSAEDEPGRTRPPDGPAGPPEETRVAADQPRAW